jgi:hypothetical protein
VTGLAKFLASREIGETGVVDLAGAYGIVEEPQGLLDRRKRIVGVHLVEVDRLDAQAAERVVKRPREVTARQPGIVGPSTRREPPLGGKHDLAADILRTRGQPAPDDLF